MGLALPGLGSVSGGWGAAGGIFCGFCKGSGHKILVKKKKINEDNMHLSIS